MDVHDLLYIVEGGWTICQGMEAFVLSADDLMFLYAHAHHFSSAPCQPNTHTLFVHFAAKPSEFEMTEVDNGDFSSYAPGNDVYLPTVIPCRNHPHIRQMLQEMVSVYWSDRKDRARHLSLMLMVLLSDLSYIASQNYAAASEWIVRVTTLMQENPSTIYTLDDLAQLIGVSGRTLSARFKAATGQTIHSYQVNRKLDIAFAIVRAEPQRTLADIACELGFCDAYHLSRLFKARFGFSPKHFRRGIL
jgi:AraC-like DNA-binding protein